MPSLARSFIVVALAASISPNRQLEAQSLPEIASVATDRGRISDRGAWSLTESPDGNLVAFVAHDSIRVYNRRQRTAVAIAPAGAGIGELNWSRRGGMLSFGRQEERGRRSMPWVIPVEPSTGRAAGAARQVSMRPMNRFDEAPVFSPDDRFIAFASNSGDTGSVRGGLKNRDRLGGVDKWNGAGGWGLQFR